MLFRSHRHPHTHTHSLSHFLTHTHTPQRPNLAPSSHMHTHTLTHTLSLPHTHTTETQPSSSHTHTHTCVNAQPQSSHTLEMTQARHSALRDEGSHAFSHMRTGLLTSITHVQISLLLCNQPPPPVSTGLHLCPQDRKSTRLNSSH